MPGRIRTAGLVALALALSACVGRMPPAQTWIGISGPPDWTPPEELRLEVAGEAWGLRVQDGGGVVTPELQATAFVRLIGVESCETYAGFEAEPGSAHAIRFADDGSAEVIDVTGQPTEMGPGLTESPPTRCPRG
jgi:hypothetical protein